MSNRTSVSNATSYQKIGDFWDAHDASETGKQDAVLLDVHIRSQGRYFAVDEQICLKIRELADQRGVSEEALLNMFLRERIDQLEKGQPAPDVASY
jgi:hypothetical protein